MIAHIRDRIDAQGGWISFESYMDLALYAPGLGYYSAGARKIGAGGDFTTAPEVSPLFGGCLARACAPVLESMGGGSMLEIGAGTGRLAVDVLRRLDTLGQLPEQYMILEVSPDLKQRQRQRLEAELPQLAGRVRWLETPPDAFEGVLIANEVLDALPVMRFRWDGEDVSELGVACGPAGLAWAARPAEEWLSATCRGLYAAAGRSWPAGYVSECCSRLAPWTATVTRGLRRGLALWIDYGLPRAQYYLAERDEGTLICHFRQRALDAPLERPGLQDITAWVDFTALAQAGASLGFELAGFTTQAWFLAGSGLEEEMRQLAGGDEQRFARLALQARQLVLPGEMGERFKVMGWQRGCDVTLPGFQMRDFTASL